VQYASRYRSRIEGPIAGTAALLFLSGFAVLATSTLFTVSRSIGLELVQDVAFWLNTVTNLLGVLIALYHFTQKLLGLRHLRSALSKKAGSDHQPRDVQTVRFMTFFLIVLTLLLLAAASAALLALSWSAIVKGLGKIIAVPFWTALASALVITTSFVLELYVCYSARCCPHPGLICELFREEIDQIFQDTMSARRAASTNNKNNNNLNNDDIPAQDQRQRHCQECWEHTVKEFLRLYRFDIIFSPARLTVLSRYLQQSDDMEPCNEI
jgi:hypothetical protein